MIPGIQYGLGVYSDGVYIRYQNKENSPQRRRKLTSVADFRKFMLGRMKKFGIKSGNDLVISCSSTMDFPEEATKNKKVIALARALR